MTVQTSPLDPTYRLSTPALIVTMLLLAMSACVLGVVIWKGYDARRTALAQSETELRNLAHSLAEHAAHSIQGAEVAMDDVVAFLRWRSSPGPAFNTHLRDMVGNLPQLNEIAVLGVNGEVRYASATPIPPVANVDRGAFADHRANADRKLRITAPLLSPPSGQPTITLTRRLETAEGDFAGIVVARINGDHFTDFYKTFDLWAGGGISLLALDGQIMSRWPLVENSGELAQSELVRTLLSRSPAGYHRAASTSDGLINFHAYEKLGRYPLVVTVTRTEQSVLAGWRNDLRTVTAVATAMLACIALLGALLAFQLRHRQRLETLLREREARFRLIDANIGDVVVLLDDGVLSFVSMSVEAVLGFKPEQILGRNCLDMVHPDDVAALRAVRDHVGSCPAGLRVEFRMARADGTPIWLEANFKLTRNQGVTDGSIVGTLRDVTDRKAMEDEVEALNTRLAELARTDGLTGLPNRRSLDGFIGRSYDANAQLSVLMIDIDDFKGFNDKLGHQVGDEALKQVAALLADAVSGTDGFAARYGGEEFTIVLPGAALAAAIAFAEKLQAAVRTLGIANPAANSGCLTVSIGIASKDTATTDSTTLLRDADMALYEAKRRGRNCCIAASTFIRDTAPLAPAEPTAGADALV